MAGQPLLSPDEALERVLAHAEVAPPQRMPAEVAGGLVVAEEVRAERDAPPFDRAMMDGYAVRAADAGRMVTLVGEIAAGQESVSDTALAPGSAVRIMTGARVPPEANAVIPVEQAEPEGNVLPVPAKVVAEQHIARRGTETRAGEVVVEPGTPITPLVLGTLVGAGADKVHVRPPARVIILATGNELNGSGAAAIRDTNSPMIAAMAESLGADVLKVMRIPDTREALLTSLEQCDTATHVLLTGGVSAGAYDLVPEALAASGGTELFHKVSQKPGKPLLVATRQVGDHRQLIFGLPGNPLASHLGVQRYVAPTLRVFMGQPPEPPRQWASLSGELRGDRTRTTFALVRLRPRSTAGEAREASGWQAEPVELRGSADLFNAATANGMVRVEPGETIPPGERVCAEWLVGCEPFALGAEARNANTRQASP